MANVVVPLGLAALGGWANGQWGALVGYTLGASLYPPDMGQTQIGDLRLQTSAYGQSIPFAIGDVRLSGNIIWTTDKVAHTAKNKVGKGGSSAATVTTTTYTVSMAILICEGPIVGIKKVWSNGNLIVDGSQTSGTFKLPGVLYKGTHDQLPDPVMESHLGVGNVPAYRGRAYMVFEDFDLGASGIVPQFSFEILTQGSFK